MTNTRRTRRQKLITGMLSLLTGQLILPDFLARGSEEGENITRYPPTHLSIPLSPSLHPFFLPPFLLLLVPSASHSPLRLSLFNLTKSSPSAAQLYSTGMEMGLSLPGTSSHGGKCQHHITGYPPPPKSYHRWVCCPCGVTTPLGFGRTRSSRGWSLPPPEGSGPDTPGPGMSLETPISPPHGRPTESSPPA